MQYPYGFDKIKTMKKRFLTIFLLSTFLSACGQTTNTTESANSSVPVLPAESICTPSPSPTLIVVSDDTTLLREEVISTPSDDADPILPNSDNPETSGALTEKVSDPAPDSPVETEEPIAPDPDAWITAYLSRMDMLDQQNGDLCVLDPSSPTGHRCENLYALISIDGCEIPALYCYPLQEEPFILIWQADTMLMLAEGEDCSAYLPSDLQLLPAQNLIPEPSHSP